MKTIPIQGKNVSKFLGLALHIITMQDDAYLAGHPEWEEIVKEAKKVLKAENINVEK